MSRCPSKQRLGRDSSENHRSHPTATWGSHGESTSPPVTGKAPPLWLEKHSHPMVSGPRNPLPLSLTFSQTALEPDPLPIPVPWPRAPLIEQKPLANEVSSWATIYLTQIGTVYLIQMDTITVGLSRNWEVFKGFNTVLKVKSFVIGSLLTSACLVLHLRRQKPFAPVPGLQPEHHLPAPSATGWGHRGWGRLLRVMQVL